MQAAVRYKYGTWTAVFSSKSVSLQVKSTSTHWLLSVHQFVEHAVQGQLHITCVGSMSGIFRFVLFSWSKRVSSALQVLLVATDDASILFLSPNGTELAAPFRLTNASGIQIDSIHLYKDNKALVTTAPPDWSMDVTRNARLLHFELPEGNTALSDKGSKPTKLQTFFSACCVCQR